MVRTDLSNLNSSEPRKVAVLNEYLEYLTDELKFLKSVDKT
jgi:hypothetical protein